MDKGMGHTVMVHMVMVQVMCHMMELFLMKVDMEFVDKSGFPNFSRVILPVISQLLPVMLQQVHHMDQKHLLTI